MKNAETIYIPIGPDLEIKVTLQARYYNGIASDPKTLVREPSISELLGVADKIRDRSLQVNQQSIIDYPDQAGPPLAELIATAILRGYGSPEATRIQLMLKRPDGSEVNLGGRCKESLVETIAGQLP